MAYRPHSTDKVPISSFSLGDWLAASLALAVGATIFIGLMFFLFVSAGMPGPYLWFGSGNRYADILSAMLGLAPAMLFANALGSFVAVGFFEMLKKLRR